MDGLEEGLSGPSADVADSGPEAVDNGAASQPEVKAEPKPDARAEAKFEPKPDVKPEPKPVRMTAKQAAQAALQAQRQAEKPAGPVVEPAKEARTGDQAVEVLKAPSRWPAERRAEFERLPVEAQRILLERDREANTLVTKVTQEAAALRKTAEGLQSLFSEDHRKQMKAAGLDEVGAVRYLLSMHDAMNRDPVSFVRRIVAEAGLRPEQIFAEKEQTVNGRASEDEWMDPHVKQLADQYAQLQQQLQQLHEAQRRAAFDAMVAEIETFEAEKDAHGNLKHPLFKDVSETMMKLLREHPELRQIPDHQMRRKLERAYELAIYADPKMRERVIEEELARRLQERQSQMAAERAAKASAVRPSPGAAAPDVKPRGAVSVRDAVRQAAAQVGLSS